MVCIIHPVSLPLTIPKHIEELITIVVNRRKKKRNGPYIKFMGVSDKVLSRGGEI